MPVTITVGVNSYAAVADGDAYFNARLRADAWTAASAADKARALIGATRLVDTFFYVGERAATTQALAWPRTSVYVDGRTLASNVVPTEVVSATCETALALLNGAALDSTDEQAGVRRVFSKVGELEKETEWAGARAARVVPDIAKRILRPLLAAGDSSSPWVV